MESFHAGIERPANMMLCSESMRPGQRSQGVSPPQGLHLSLLLLLKTKGDDFKQPAKSSETPTYY
eukprot:1159604-Pelagomonas_calceolata.AAC.1